MSAALNLPEPAPLADRIADAPLRADDDRQALHPRSRSGAGRWPTSTPGTSGRREAILSPLTRDGGGSGGP